MPSPSCTLALELFKKRTSQSSTGSRSKWWEIGLRRPIRLTRSSTILPRPPPLTSLHRDGWRMEHLEALSRDMGFATALATLIFNIASGDVPTSTADYFASATLVALMKKNEDDIKTLRELLGMAFVLPIRPLAMASVFVKLACNCMLSDIKDDIVMDVTGPCHFAVGCKGDASPCSGRYKRRWKRTLPLPKLSWMRSTSLTS